MHVIIPDILNLGPVGLDPFTDALHILLGDIFWISIHNRIVLHSHEEIVSCSVKGAKELAILSTFSSSKKTQLTAEHSTQQEDMHMAKWESVFITLLLSEAKGKEEASERDSYRKLACMQSELAGMDAGR